MAVFLDFLPRTSASSMRSKAAVGNPAACPYAPVMRIASRPRRSLPCIQVSSFLPAWPHRKAPSARSYPQPLLQLAPVIGMAMAGMIAIKLAGLFGAVGFVGAMVLRLMSDAGFGQPAAARLIDSAPLPAQGKALQVLNAAAQGSYAEHVDAGISSSSSPSGSHFTQAEQAGTSVDIHPMAVTTCGDGSSSEKSGPLPTYQQMVQEYAALLQTSTQAGKPLATYGSDDTHSSSAPACCNLYRSLVQEYRELMAIQQTQQQVTEAAAAAAAVSPTTALEFASPYLGTSAGLSVMPSAAQAPSVTSTTSGHGSAEPAAAASASTDGAVGPLSTCYQLLVEEYQTIISTMQAERDLAEAVDAAVAVAPTAAMEFSPLCLPLTAASPVSVPGVMPV